MFKKIKVALVFGTRPEAIKMCPLVNELKSRDNFDVTTIVTAQHREMLDQVLELFNVTPDCDLNIMKPNQNLWSLTSDILLQTKEIFEQEQFDIVLVHGDTTTAFVTSLSAFYARVPIGHVEAGLRTYDRNYPFPEEINRVICDSLTSMYFAPTSLAVANLKKYTEVNPENIYKTGNTVIDALLYTVSNSSKKLDFLSNHENKKIILMTAHRRENFGQPLEDICKAVLEIVSSREDVEFIYPVHPNPNVRKTVNSYLANAPGVKLIDPLEYEDFSLLMKKSYLILTDSGGIQEEAPALGVPVLVLRNETERPEAINAGCVKLVGTKKDNIVKNILELLDCEDSYYKMAKSANPYGDGTACVQIADAIEEQFMPKFKR